MCFGDVHWGEWTLIYNNSDVQYTNSLHINGWNSSTVYMTLSNPLFGEGGRGGGAEDLTISYTWGYIIFSQIWDYQILLSLFFVWLRITDEGSVPELIK